MSAWAAPLRQAACTQAASGGSRFRERTVAFMSAMERAAALGRRLVVIGDPDDGMHTRLARAYGCGDVCVDLNGCPKCPMTIVADITKGPVPELAADSSVVFVACVLEYVPDLEAARGSGCHRQGRRRSEDSGCCGRSGPRGGWSCRRSRWSCRLSCRWSCRWWCRRWWLSRRSWSAPVRSWRSWSWRSWSCRRTSRCWSTDRWRRRPARGNRQEDTAHVRDAHGVIVSSRGGQRNAAPCSDHQASHDWRT